jgi:hypothetical protein
VVHQHVLQDPQRLGHNKSVQINLLQANKQTNKQKKTAAERQWNKIITKGFEKS